MAQTLKRRDVLTGSVALAAMAAVGVTTCVASATGSGLEVYEVTGTIKWFDDSKGYGFVVPDNGLPDILLHKRCLETSGFPAVSEGARVRLQAMPRPKGMQAFRILDLDRSSEVADPHPRTHVHVTALQDA